MKTALIGAGKTGKHVKELLGDDNVTIYNTSRNPTPEKLKKADVAIIFVPGNSVENLIKPVLASGIPAVWGTTGYQWPENLSELVKVNRTRWVMASNFSLGMHLVRKCLAVIGRGSEVLVNPEFHIHEVHHKDKQDAPSGTALKWADWLGINDVQISWNREGDVNGIHTMHVKTDFESIYLKHEAHTRAVFAQGAVWASRFLLNHSEILPGLYSFESIIDLAFEKTQ